VGIHIVSAAVFSQPDVIKNELIICLIAVHTFILNIVST